MRKYLLVKLSHAIIRYSNLLVRHDYTSKHRGEDSTIDDSILAITLSKIYELSLDEMHLENYNAGIALEIEHALSAETIEKLDEIKNEYKYYISIITKLEKDHSYKIPRIFILKLLKILIETKRKSKKIYSYFRELHREKITLSYGLIGTFLTIITPTIALGSLLRQYQFSLAFNFRMGLVYNFDDYLSASISTIITIIIPMIIACLVSGIIIISDRGHDPINISYNAKGSIRDLKIINIFVIFLLIFSFIKNRNELYIIAPVLAFILLLNPLTTFLMKNFNNGKSIFFYLMIVFMFFSNIYSATQLEIKNIKDEDKEYNVSILSTNDFELYNNFVIVTYGSRNVVLYNKITAETLLLNPNEIKKIHIYNGVSTF